MRAVYNGICISSDFFLLWHPGLRRPCFLKRPMKVAKEGLRRYTCATNRNSPWTWDTVKTHIALPVALYFLWSLLEISRFRIPSVKLQRVSSFRPLAVRVTRFHLFSITDNFPSGVLAYFSCAVTTCHFFFSFGQFSSLSCCFPRVLWSASQFFSIRSSLPGRLPVSTMSAKNVLTRRRAPGGRRLIAI